ncbi:hypothetical protein Tco_1018633 [Tanacetum coccineum]|uniref:Uncharacterized protein n=1 Tax=Tanacetum coccineum TaxID=301880 RepID=A0ABQ5FUX1_9ASTR
MVPSQRYKARLNGANEVATQLAGFMGIETFSSVVQTPTFGDSTQSSTSRTSGRYLTAFDVKNALSLHGSLSETVYMHQPPGFFAGYVATEHLLLICSSRLSLFFMQSLAGGLTLSTSYPDLDILIASAGLPAIPHTTSYLQWLTQCRLGGFIPTYTSSINLWLFVFFLQQDLRS